MRIVVAADHGGFFLKDELFRALEGLGHTVSDLGAFDSNSVDYPDYAHKAAAGIASGEWERAVLVCGTGVGMSIAANRHAAVRAVVCSDVYTAKLSREHNNANVLCLGARVVGTGLAHEILTTWLQTGYDPSQSRHARRVEKIELTTGSMRA